MKLPAYPRTKPSGVEWLGDVPEHWEVKRLSYLATLKSGENITSEMIAEGGDYPVYGGNGLRGNYHKFTHRGHHALIGRQGALCGNINYASGEFYASEHALVVSPLKEFAVVWMGELLRAMNLGQYSVTAAQPGIAAEMIRGLRIPVPPLAEQRSIAAFLDRETGRVDRLVAKKRELIERLKEKRTALISRTVTRGLRDQNIQLMRLRRLLDRIDTGFTPDSYNFPAQVGQQGVLKSGCVNGGIFDPNENKLLADDVDPPASLEVKVGDILMSRASGSSELIGSVAQVRAQPAAKLYLSDKTFRLRVNKANCDGAFLVAAMGSSFLRSQLSQIISGAQGLAKNIAQSDMRELLVPFPPLPEQAAIAAYLDEETAKLDALVGKVEEAVERLQEYRTALITAAVTGKIDVRNAPSTR